MLSVCFIQSAGLDEAMAYKNKADRQAASRRSYEKHKLAKKLRADAARRRNYRFTWNYKAAIRCCKCNMDDPRALDFHHVGVKTIDVARAAGLGWSIERLLTEIVQCVVLCANCHRIETHQRRLDRRVEQPG